MGSGIKMEKREDASYIYILECSDGTFYTGWTDNIEKRISAHNAKKGAKYTRSRTPVRLVYFERANTRREAMQREAEIKRLSRREKEQLIEKREDRDGCNKI